METKIYAHNGDERYLFLALEIENEDTLEYLDSFLGDQLKRDKDNEVVLPSLTRKRKVEIGDHIVHILATPEKPVHIEIDNRRHSFRESEFIVVSHEEVNSIFETINHER